MTLFSVKFNSYINKNVCKYYLHDCSTRALTYETKISEFEKRRIKYICRSTQLTFCLYWYYGVMIY